MAFRGTKKEHAARALRAAKEAVAAARSATKRGMFCTTSLRFLTDGYARYGAAAAHLSEAASAPGKGPLTKEHYDALDAAENAVRDARNTFEDRCGIDLKKRV